MGFAELQDLRDRYNIDVKIESQVGILPVEPDRYWTVWIGGLPTCGEELQDTVYEAVRSFKHATASVMG